MTLATLLCRLSPFTGGECEYARKFEDGRVYLQCIHCGNETPGWETAKSDAYYAAAFDEMVTAELELHCGG